MKLNCFANAIDIGGGTALPICLYLSITDPLNTKLSGKPCDLAASLTDIILF